MLTELLRFGCTGFGDGAGLVPPPKLAGHREIEAAVFLAFFGSAEYFDRMSVTRELALETPKCREKQHGSASNALAKSTYDFAITRKPAWPNNGAANTETGRSCSELDERTISVDYPTPWDFDFRAAHQAQ